MKRALLFSILLFILGQNSVAADSSLQKEVDRFRQIKADPATVSVCESVLGDTPQFLTVDHYLFENTSKKVINFNILDISLLDETIPVPKRVEIDKDTLSELKMLSKSYDERGELFVAKYLTQNMNHIEEAFNLKSRIENETRSPLVDLKELRRRGRLTRELVSNSSISQILGVLRTDLVALAKQLRSVGDQETLASIYHGRSSDMAPFDRYLKVHIDKYSDSLYGTRYRWRQTKTSFGSKDTPELGMILSALPMSYLVARFNIDRAQRRAITSFRDSLTKLIAELRQTGHPEFGLLADGIELLTKAESLNTSVEPFELSFRKLHRIFYYHSRKTRHLALQEGDFAEVRARSYMAAHISLSELLFLDALVAPIMQRPDFFSLPNYVDSETAYVNIEDGHNVITLYQKGVEDSVPNSIEMDASDPNRQVFLLSGVNNGKGKTGMISMTLQLQILAQIGAAVPAQNVTVAPGLVISFMTTRADNENADSTFQSQARVSAQVLRIIEEIAGSVPISAVVDESFYGASKYWQEPIVLNFLRELKKHNVVSIMITQESHLHSLPLIPEFGIGVLRNTENFQVVEGAAPSAGGNAPDVLREFGHTEEFVQGVLEIRERLNGLIEGSSGE